jgi:N-acetyl-alpha-D-glucosaminyl L-malate synthase BshA
MKIGINCYPTYGGSGVVAVELGKALAERGHQIHFISYAMPKRLEHFYENIYFHEVEFSAYPLFEFPLYTISLASKIVDVYEYEQLDVFHAHYAIPHAVSSYLAKQILLKKGKKISCVTTLHGTDITLVGLEPSFLPMMKFSIEESCGVTAVSNYLKNKTIDNFKVEKEIKVINNFVDTNVFYPKPNYDLRKKLAPNGEKLLIHISNFRPVKRTQDCVLILSKIAKEISVKLIFVGDGPERQNCERLVRDLDLAKSVFFLGKQDALPEILNACDIFLMPSQSESFGLSALEAMACGLPVICSNVGGLPELVIDQKTGYICEVGDIETMSKRAIELLTDVKKYASFSEESLKRAVLEFNKNKIVDQYEKYYLEIISKRDECFSRI